MQRAWGTRASHAERWERWSDGSCGVLVYVTYGLLYRAAKEVEVVALEQ